MDSLIANSGLTLVALWVLLGTMNYWFFNQLNLLNFFNKTNNDEKISLITLLGLLNYFAYITVDVIVNIKNKHIEQVVVLITSIVFALGLQLLFFYLVRIVSSLVIKKYFKGKRSYTFHATGFEQVLNDSGHTQFYVYAYDFQNNLIEQGYLNHNSDDVSGTEAYLSMALPDKYEAIELNEARRSDQVFIDYKNKLKIYIVYLK